MPQNDMFRTHEFLKAAAEAGIEEAIDEYGDAVSAKEAAAIGSLTPEELNKLYELNKKIRDAAYGDAEAHDWAVGSIC